MFLQSRKFCLNLFHTFSNMNILSCIYFFAGHPVYILSFVSFWFLYLFFVDYLMTVDVVILASTYILNTRSSSHVRELSEIW